MAAWGTYCKANSCRRRRPASERSLGLSGQRSWLASKSPQERPKAESASSRSSGSRGMPSKYLHVDPSCRSLAAPTALRRSSASQSPRPIQTSATRAGASSTSRSLMNSTSSRRVGRSDAWVSMNVFAQILARLFDDETYLRRIDLRHLALGRIDPTHGPLSFLASRRPRGSSTPPRKTRSATIRR
jgi:hypothetical protein